MNHKPSGSGLASTEYINDSNAITGTLTDNVRFTASAAITATPTAINALVLDSATAIALTGSASSMEVTSGTLLFAGAGTHSITGITELTTGADYSIFTTGTATVTLAPKLASAVPLVKSGAGTLKLTHPTNNISSLVINQGVVEITTQLKSAAARSPLLAVVFKLLEPASLAIWATARGT